MIRFSIDYVIAKKRNSYVTLKTITYFKKLLRNFKNIFTLLFGDENEPLTDVMAFAQISKKLKMTMKAN